MNSSLKNIYYRGILSSCNYSCSYCPFAKRKSNQAELKKDFQQLNRFYREIENTTFDKPVGIFFTPYGEALIHNYYIEMMAKLSKLKSIKYVSCQTNFSFDIDKFLGLIKENDGDLSKIKLWATYHSEMIDPEIFSNKAKIISEHIDISVGMVAIPGKSDEVVEFREVLSQNIYLWINGKAREKSRYTKKEIDKLINVDPLFGSELFRHKVEKNCCTSGVESIFIEANGDIYPCNINKNKLGNFYESKISWKEVSCKRRICDCFLAYSNRKDILHVNYFSDYKYIRLPEKVEVEAIFLDIDGTLTDKNGKISSKTISCIEELAKYKKIYLATSLPYEFAMKKCHQINKYIDGGIFGNGGLIMDYSKKFIKIMEIESIKDLDDIKIYKWKDKIYKALTRNNKVIDNFKDEDLIFTKEKSHISIHSRNASKLNGILSICNINKFERKKVFVMGNSKNDIDMIKYFENSVAVIDSEDNRLKDNAKYIMNIEHLVMFLKG